MLGGDAPDALRTVQEMARKEWKVDLCAKARDGSSALHLAAAGGHGRMVKALLSAPNVKRNGGGRAVDLSSTDRRGRTALDVAAAAGFDDVAGLLEGAASRLRARESAAEGEQHAALLRAMGEMRAGGMAPLKEEVGADGAEGAPFPNDAAMGSGDEDEDDDEAAGSQ